MELRKFLDESFNRLYVVEFEVLCLVTTALIFIDRKQSVSSYILFNEGLGWSIDLWLT